jgi:broad specificity phosphatase PhoE
MVDGPWDIVFLARHGRTEWNTQQRRQGQLDSRSPRTGVEQATRHARELGMSRSEFFARAAQLYLDELDAHSLTQQIDEALQVTSPDESASDAAGVGRRRLADEDEW